MGFCKCICALESGAGQGLDSVLVIVPVLVTSPPLLLHTQLLHYPLEANGNLPVMGFQGRQLSGLRTKPPHCPTFPFRGILQVLLTRASRPDAGVASFEQGKAYGKHCASFYASSSPSQAALASFCMPVLALGRLRSLPLSSADVAPHLHAAGELHAPRRKQC